MVTPIPDSFLPLELVFNPNWWHTNAGVSFDENFYLDSETRIQNDVTMRRVLHQRYGELGLGEENPQPRPIIGSMHVAGGFIIPALFGLTIQFESNAAPQAEALNLTVEQIEKLEKPDFKNTFPMNRLIADMDALEGKQGYVVGDLNTDGVLNTAYQLYGQELFSDFYEAPNRVRRLLGIIGELIADVAAYIHSRTRSYSVAVNRMASRLTPTPYLHANCSVQMISPDSYREMQLPVEHCMAAKLQPYGIHHCGNNLHLIAKEYAKVDASYFEVGWGSDVAQSRRWLPNAFLNLRLSPVRMLQCTPPEIAADTEKVLRAVGSLEKVGICCINMDAGTPDENIFAMFEVIQKFRKYGA
jgi:uroporphyrinogen-III decarboxylase